MLTYLKDIKEKNTTGKSYSFTLMKKLAEREYTKLNKKNKIMLTEKGEKAYTALSEVITL